MIKDDQLISRNSWVDDSTDGKGCAGGIPINQGEVGLIASATSLAFESVRIGPLNSPCLISMLFFLFDDRIFHHRERVPRDHHAHQEYLGSIWSIILGILGGILELGGEVDTLAVVPLIGGPNCSESLLTDLPHCLFAGPLEHRDHRRLAAIIPAELGSEVGVPGDKLLSLVGLRQGPPIFFLEQMRAGTKPDLKDVAVVLEVVEELPIGDCKDLDSRSRFKSKLGGNLDEFVKGRLVIGVGAFCDKERRIADGLKANGGPSRVS